MCISNSADLCISEEKTSTITYHNDAKYRFTPLREWLLASVVFAILLTIFFYPAVCAGELIYSGNVIGSDLLDFNIPRRYLVAEAIKSGEFPQWEPLIGCGTTVQAEGHPGTFYPFTLPLNLFCSVTNAANFAVFLALYTAFLGCYWLARTYKVHPFVALLIAMSYAFGGTYIFQLRQLNIINVLAWTPIALAGLHLYLSDGRQRWLFVVGVAWVAQVLAGHPQVACLCQLTYWIYIVSLLCQLHYRRPDVPNLGRQLQNPSLKRSLVQLVVVGILSLLLSAAQWLPTYEMTKLSTRSDAIPELVQRFDSYRPDLLICLFNPYYYGNPAKLDINRDNSDLQRPTFGESRLYWGVIPLLLVPFAFAQRTRHYALVISIPLLFHFLLSFGPQCPFYTVCHKLLPILAKFRSPCRFFAQLSILIAILSALGIDNVYTILSKRNIRLAYTVMTLIFLVTAIDLNIVNSKFQEYLPSNWCNRPVTLDIIGSQHGRIFSPLSCARWKFTIGQTGWRDQIPLLKTLLLELPNDLSTIWGGCITYRSGLYYGRYRQC